MTTINHPRPDRSTLYVIIVFFLALGFAITCQSCSPQLTNTTGNYKYRKVIGTHDGYVYYYRSEKNYLRTGKCFKVPVLEEGDSLVFGDYLVFD